MNLEHLSDNLAAFVDGQLPAVEHANATMHLTGCAECRAAHGRYEFAATLLRALPVVSAPAEVWDGIEHALRTNTTERRGSAAILRPGWGLRPVVALAATIALAAAAVVLWQARTIAPWEIVRLDTPGGETRLSAGEWIQTNAASRALIRIGTIGTVDIAPNSRLQVVSAGETEQRLNLAFGSLSAQILAPPRIFFVQTPASTVVDLGCAYTMDVDPAGTGLLRVTSGWASLEWGDRESIVPAGASCPTRPHIGPGTPVFDDATERLKAAVLAFDFADGGAVAIDTVLAEARDRDTLTLWHLLSRVDSSERQRVFDRMRAFAPLPAGVTRDAALALDRGTLQRWREELAWTW